MKLSVIIPIYNVGRYLREALDSLTGQTYRDIEIICIDDGSTDDSRQIIQEYAERDARIKTISQPNSGLYATRQVGIRMASGDYIVFVDGDDWLEGDACEKIVELAEGSHADIIQYGLEVEAPDKQAADVRWFDSWFNVAVDSIDGAEEMLTRCYEKCEIPWNIATKAIRTDVAKKAVSCQESLYINQLEDFLSCFFLFSFSQKWIRLDCRLYHYRYSVGMSTKQTVTMDHFKKNLGYFHGLRTLQSFVASRPVSPAVRRLADEVIPQYVMEDALHFAILRLDSSVDSKLWVDTLAHAAGSETTLHALAAKLADNHASLVRSQTETQHLVQSLQEMRKRKGKYRRLFGLMCVISVLLLAALFVFVVFP